MSEEVIAHDENTTLTNIFYKDESRSNILRFTINVLYSVTNFADLVVIFLKVGSNFDFYIHVMFLFYGASKIFHFACINLIAMKMLTSLFILPVGSSDISLLYCAFFVNTLSVVLSVFVPYVNYNLVYLGMGQLAASIFISFRAIKIYIPNGETLMFSRSP